MLRISVEESDGRLERSIPALCWGDCPKYFAYNLTTVESEQWKIGQPPQQNSGLARLNHPPLSLTLILSMSYTNLHFKDCLPIWAVVDEHNTQMCATLLTHAPRVRTIDGSIKRYPCELKKCVIGLKCSTHKKVLKMTSYTVKTLSLKINY